MEAEKSQPEKPEPLGPVIPADAFKEGCCPSPGPPEDEPCCGNPPGPRSAEFEKPGYSKKHFVEAFQATAVGPVPRVATVLDRRDGLENFLARWGIGRNDYKVAPGLYCVGRPDAESPVLVTANYKLTFDALRKELSGLQAWVLVLDTRGINVWCAAGKQLFSTAEVVRQVRRSRLERVINHHDLIVPQLAATGVSAHQVKKESGFNVLWGPIRARDIKPFLGSGSQADKLMRTVTFSMPERVVLIPVELSGILKICIWVFPAFFILSGIGPGIFSLTGAWQRWTLGLAAIVTGVAAGAILTPMLLPWIPGKAFSLKGALTGLAAGLCLTFALLEYSGVLGAVALLLVIITVSSYLAMNFTGSTPYTSPSGVEKEMRRAIPLQAGSVLAGLVLWVGSAFLV